MIPGGNHNLSSAPSGDPRLDAILVPPMNIRKARPRDVDALVGLWIEFMDFHTALDSGFVRAVDAADRWAAYITERIEDCCFAVLVAEIDGEVVGYVVATEIQYPPITTIRSYGFLQEIAVTEKHRKRGIGRRLFEAAEQWLLDRGVSRIEVKVDVLNPDSRAFWESAGFAPHTETLIKHCPVTKDEGRLKLEGDPRGTALRPIRDKNEKP